MQRILMLSLSIAVVTWAANAFADSPNLMGAYGFTRTVKCIVSHTGFDTKPLWEFPRLCRGGSKSLTFPEVGSTGH